MTINKIKEDLDYFISKQEIKREKCYPNHQRDLDSWVEILILIKNYELYSDDFVGDMYSYFIENKFNKSEVEHYINDVRISQEILKKL